MLLSKSFRGPRVRPGVPVPALLAGAFLLASVASARADWRVYRYQVEIDRAGETVYEEDGESKNVQMYDPDGDEYDGWSHIKYDTQDRGDYLPDMVEAGAELLSFPFAHVPLGAGKGHITLSVTPWYKWEPMSENEPPAQYIFTRETSVVWVGRRFNNDQSPANPYDGAGIDVDQADDGFGTPPVYMGTGYPFAGGYGSGPFLNAYGNWYTYHFGILASGGASEVPGPTRHLNVEVKSAGWTFHDDNEYANAEATLKYKAEIAHYNLRGRRKGSSDSFGGEVTTAAGGKAGAEHYAEIQIDAGAPYVPLSDLPKVILMAPTGQGVNRSAQFIPREVPGGVTDDTGKAIVGEVWSKDCTTNYNLWPTAQGPVVANFDLGAGTWSPSVNVHHAWGGDWKAQAGGLDPVATDFSYGMPVPMSFKPGFLDVPITGHTMKFLAEQVISTDWDEESDAYVWRTLTDDGSLPGGGGTSVPGSTAGYATFTPEQVTGDVFSTEMTVPFNARKVVHAIKPAAEDQDTYEP